MIRYLRHKEIDRTLWDECILQAINTRVYACSWYLDIVSPGWDALVEGNYDAVFPLTHKRKASIHYLFQPFFTQQLGLFSATLISQERVSMFLDSIPAKFKFVEIQLNTLNKVDSSGFDVIPRINHELDLIRGYEQIARNYSENTRRNIKKAFKNEVIIGKKTDPDELIALFRKTYGKREGKLKYIHYEQIRKIIQLGLTKHRGFILGAFRPQDELSAAAFFLRDTKRYYYLFAASGETARNNGAMFILVDHFIREQAGNPLTLDFEGGNDPNLGRFYKGFGAQECSYPFIRINRLPALIRFLKKDIFV
jgi:hypothetical protein